MVGLSVVLDNTTASSSSQVVSKASMIIKPPSPTSCSPSPVSPSGKSPFSRRTSPAAMVPATGFLDCCFLCKRRLLPGKDIYMYKGDRGFCSVECRCRQIVMDEEEQAAMKPPSSSKRDHCSLAARKPQRPTPSSAGAPPPPPKARRGATGNRPNAFAY